MGLAVYFDEDASTAHNNNIDNWLTKDSNWPNSGYRGCVAHI